jgi:hypothetical protein
MGGVRQTDGETRLGASGKVASRGERDDSAAGALKKEALRAGWSDPDPYLGASWYLTRRYR